MGDFFGVQILTYLDVGAHHPRELNNTYRFYLKGAWGVAVDPNPRFKTLYEKYRPNDIFINAAIGTQHRDQVTYFMIEPDTLSTTSRAAADDARSFGHKSVGELIFQSFHSAR